MALRASLEIRSSLIHPHRNSLERGGREGEREEEEEEKNVIQTFKLAHISPSIK